VRRIGQRYELFGAMAAGGTATVHLGRLHGMAGFMKPIAVKRLHPHLAADPALRTILVEEARLVSRISHPNVVAVLDIVEDEGELFLVLEYVHGATLFELMAKGERCTPATAVAVMKDVLTGLHAAHHARDASGALLGLVHRDVSPRNVIVTTDGVGKILDFGIAKARVRQSTTRDGHIRGSLAYMAPEQLADETLTARTDVYGAAVVLWEALTGARLFQGDTDAAIVKRILDHDVRAPSTVVGELPRSLDMAVLRGLARDPEARFASGLEMALALEESLTPARSAVVAAWVMRIAETELARRQALVDETPGESGEEEAGPVAGGARAAEATLAAPEPIEEAHPVARAKPWTRPPAVIAIAMVIGVVSARLMGAWGAGSASAAADAAVRGAEGAGAEPSAGAAGAEPSAGAGAAGSGAATAASALGAGAPNTSTSAPNTSASAKAPRASTVKGRAVVDAAAPSGAECAPYFVDSAGVRRFNRECLK